MLAAGAALAAPAGVLDESAFSVPMPAAWETQGNWTAAPAGARADGACTVAWKSAIPAEALIEVIVDLPEQDALGKGASVALTLGSGKDDPARLTASCSYTKVSVQTKLAGTATNKKPVEAIATRDTRPSAWLEFEARRGTESQAAAYPGWASTTVSLGLLVRQGDCRLLLNGSDFARAALVAPAVRQLSLAAKGVTVRRVRILSALPAGYTCLGGAGMALLSGGLDSRAASGIAAGKMESRQLDVLGIPMRVQLGRNGIATLAVGAEGMPAPGGTVGAPRTPVPVGLYRTAYLLFHDDGAGTERQAALGFTLRPGVNPGGEVRNIYVGALPDTEREYGVRVRPVPALGPGWYLARAPLNPAALQWFTHAPNGTLLPPETPATFDFSASRPWGPYPGPFGSRGRRSSLQLAAVTLEHAAMDLTVTGNGMGNVFSEPDGPRLTASLRNLTDRPLRAALTIELYPLERPGKTQRRTLSLKPGATVTVDALAAPVRERGHYRVRVLTEAGTDGAIDYRTNLALLAPDTRKKVDSPFGIWPQLYGETATDAQRAYLKEKAGVGFYYDRDYVCYNPGTPMPDDAAAETFIAASNPKVRIVMLGWEQTWEKYTFSLPRIISEGVFEEHSPEQLAKMDEAVARFRRVIRAARTFRPNAKISLGNSGINYTVPLLERGLKFGTDFDYFGTEEGVYSFLPERWDSSIGNVNWWTKAASDHYGFADVPIFHSESYYYNTGFGLGNLSGRNQAAYYTRLYLLGFPYRSIYGFSAAIIDSGNDYAYSLWGTPGYCNVAPECSPKPSFVAYATLTQLLDGAQFDRLLETGSTSVYALQFRRTDGSPLYAIWNVYGARHVSLAVAAGGHPVVRDAFNRPVAAPVKAGRMTLAISDLPTYVSGATLTTMLQGGNVPEPPTGGTLLARLDRADDWTVETGRDGILEEPAWCMPRVPGAWRVATATLPAIPGLPAAGGKAPALSLRLQPPTDDKPLGVLARYVALTRAPGKEIPIPKGTTRLGIWLYGRSTWSQVKIGAKNTSTGAAGFIGREIFDNFDGWRFVELGSLQDSLADGHWAINRLAVCMPPKQVYVKDVRPTANPEVAVGAIVAFADKLSLINYLPW